MGAVTFRKYLRVLILGYLSLLVASIAAAQQAPATQEDAWDAARRVAKQGPQDIPLADQAVLKLPEGRVFIPQPEATKLLNAMGNPGEDPRLQGLIFPTGSDDGWFMSLRYESSGFIKDDDAKDWDADELLDTFKQGTEASNQERVKLGVPEMEILGWAEKPVYDATSHRLAWAMKSRDKGNANDANLGVNYNTYVLGRDGYFSMNLVTDLASLPAHKPHAHAVLEGLNYTDGKRYADFNSSTDRVAEYGLAALVVGVGAKKLGLFAVIAAFALKFAKLGLLALVPIGLGLKRLFGRKSTTS